MEIVILGGSKLIGTALIEELARQHNGIRIHVVNRGITPPFINYSKLKNCKVIKHIADRTSPLDFKETLEKITFKNKIDAVIDTSCYMPDELTPAIRAFSNKIKHYILISTCAVYGKLKYVPANEDHPLDISAENSMYGREKIKCEHEITDANKHKCFNTTILRPSYIYGPNDYTRRLFYFIDRIYNDIPILAPGEQTDFLFNAIYITDLAKQICMALLNEKFYGGVFNLSSSDSINFSDFLKLIGCAMNKEIKLMWIPKNDYKKITGELHFPYYISNAAYDCAKFRALCGEENFPFTPYYEGISQTIKWHREKKELPSGKNYNNELSYADNQLN
ncbi:MAG: NAD-dependent epimerase/dehydratase family protein [Candidatus Wallbacteria bacterium]